MVAEAIELLEVGLRSPIVVIETALPETTVRALAKQINGDRRPASGPLPAPHAIATSRIAALEASLWATLYLRLSSKEILHAVDMPALVASFHQYRSFRTALPERRTIAHDVNHLWVLARSIRTEEVALHRCGTCGVQYLTFEGQRQRSGCPLCIKQHTRLAPV